MLFLRDSKIIEFILEQITIVFQVLKGFYLSLNLKEWLHNQLCTIKMLVIVRKEQKKLHLY